MIARVSAADPGLFVLKSALRPAIVVPFAVAIALEIVGDKEMAVFAAFGSMALLVFVDFGGSRRTRVRAYLALIVAGAVLITLGTLCSRSTLLATVAMAIVAFTILFAGVLDDYVAAARTGAMLTFVLPVMIPADAGAIPMRLAGWGVAGALSLAAVLLLWPARPRSALLGRAAAVARLLADLTDARARGDGVAALAAGQDARKQTTALRDRFVAMGQRPSGTAGPTAALGRLIEDLASLYRIADQVPPVGADDAACRAERAELLEAAPLALRELAARLDGGLSRVALDVERISRAHDAFGHAQLAYFESLRSDCEEVEAAAEIEEAYRLRQLSYSTLQACADGVQACDDRGHRVSADSRRMRIGATSRIARTHASIDSVWLRNSVRGAVGLALAVLVGQLIDVQHAFWIVLGTMSVLRTSAFSTTASIAWALLGTFGGIVVGGLIILAVGGEHGVLWAVLPLAVLLASYAGQAISFAAGQAAFSVVVLVLFNLLQPAGWRVGIVRVEDVAIGAGVSLLVGLIIWPRGAASILRRTIGAAYISASHYLDATIAALLGEGEDGERADAAREAIASGQLLDAAVRDYLANRNAASGRLHDLTVLSSGAIRVRRVAGVLERPDALVRLAPVDEDLPRLLDARDAFDRERHALSDWYRSLGTSIANGSPPPQPENAGEPGAFEPEQASDRGVVLEPAAVGRGLQPGIAIAWAYRHIDALAELEPTLTAAYTRIIDGAAAGG
jgi:uncharacterized membrane protein YccC